jgi:hypothetical protein
MHGGEPCDSAKSKTQFFLIFFGWGGGHWFFIIPLKSFYVASNHAAVGYWASMIK